MERFGLVGVGASRLDKYKLVHCFVEFMQSHFKHVELIEDLKRVPACMCAGVICVMLCIGAC